MWRSSLLKLGYTVNAYLTALGLRQHPFVRGLKRLVRRTLMPTDGLLIDVRGVRMFIPSDTEAPHEYLLQPFEPFTTTLLTRAVRSGATVVDIGAQFGHFTLLAARAAGPEGRVYAFEPAPSNFRLLERNIAINKLTNVVPLQTAVGKAPAVVRLFIYSDSDSHSLFRHPQARVRDVVDVASVALDDFLEGRRVDVIKMDIEGNEPYALEGMKATVLHSPALVLFAELAPAYLRRAGVEPSAYLAQLRSLGFIVQLIEERSHTLTAITPERIAAAETDPSWHANLYCTKREMVR